MRRLFLPSGMAMFVFSQDKGRKEGFQNTPGCGLRPESRYSRRGTSERVFYALSQDEKCIPGFGPVEATECGRRPVDGLWITCG